MLRLISVVLSVMAVVVVTSEVAFINSDLYQTWKADLKPGFIIKKMHKGSQKCYCKVPMLSSSSIEVNPSESFSFNPGGLITTSSQSSSIFEYHFMTRPPRNAS